MDQEVAKISQVEMRTLKRMKSGETVGSDGVPVEVWKCLGEVAEQCLTRLTEVLFGSDEDG